MKLCKRVVFVTSCALCLLSAAFLAVSLSTDRWVEADIRRNANPNDADGHVYFGLFDGKRELNVGYGWRTYPISVIDRIDVEPDFVHKGVWAATVFCVIGSLIFAILGTLTAVVNSVTTPKESMAGRVGLLIWIGFGIVFSLTAIMIWITHFYLRLVNNVLVTEDRENHWTSDGDANLGYSFWFVLASVVCHGANVGLLVQQSRKTSRSHGRPIPTDKTNGAVLLY